MFWRYPEVFADRMLGYAAGYLGVRSRSVVAR
jgi:hypothetical protein